MGRWGLSWDSAGPVVLGFLGHLRGECGGVHMVRRVSVRVAFMAAAYGILLVCILCAEAAGADFSRWDHKMKITFSGYTKTEPLTNFPVLVVLNEDIPGFDYSHFAFVRNR